MKKVYYVGSDTHKESIAIAIAEEAGEVRFYGTTGGTLDALDKTRKKIEKPEAHPSELPGEIKPACPP
jgi:hypothetical protein